jgi:hypothetical protein
MARILLYNGLLLLVVIYAMARGGRSERAAALIMLAGSLLTKVVYAPFANRFGDVELTVLLVDAAGFVGFTIVALKSDRYWPIWIAALQLIGMLVHLAKLIEPAMLRTGYAFMLAIWSYPMLALIAFGTWSHHRRQRRMSSS